MNTKIHIYGLTLGELEALLVKNNFPKFRAKQIWNWLYINKISEFKAMTNLNKELITWLELNVEPMTLSKVKSEKDRESEKILVQLKDHNKIENVLMEHNYGLSFCVSTQVGCPMGCRFCASGKFGLVRNLQTHELVEQLVLAAKSTKMRISRIVLMGIGEPFLNFDNVIKFLDIVSDENGFNLAARHITVSTSGIPQKILEFAKINKQYNLAISLHAPSDEIREKIMPEKNHFPVAEILDAVTNYQKLTNRQVIIEYIMIKDINDSEKCAKMLTELLGDLMCKVNLIPYNEVDGVDFASSSQESVMKFAAIVKKKFPVTTRIRFGNKIDGACGQLMIRNR